MSSRAGEPPEIVVARDHDYGRRDYDPQKMKYEISRRRNQIGRLIFERPVVILTLFSLAVTGGFFALTETKLRNKGEGPYFRPPVAMGNCLVSLDTTPVRALPGEGMDALIWRADAAKLISISPQCLRQTGGAIVALASEDGNPLNDIHYAKGDKLLKNPIVAPEIYEIPLEATPRG